MTVAATITVFVACAGVQPAQASSSLDRGTNSAYSAPAAQRQPAGSSSVLAADSTARSIAKPASLISTSGAGRPQREIFGFALASSLSDPTLGYPSWNFDLLSTVAFFGLHVATDGQFVGDQGWSVWNSSALTSMVAIAHQHGAKVVLTVILQDFSPNTPSMCAGLAHADATVAEAVHEVAAKGVDGVNIDYEGLDGSCGTSDPFWAQHAMTGFAQKMRAALGSSYLSIDTYSGAAGDGYGFFDIVGLSAYVDSFFVMAYDMEYSNYSRAPVYCGGFCLGPTSPLTGYYYNDTAVMADYKSVVAASKVILGVPYYGRKACVANAGSPNQYPTSSVVADSYLDASTEVSYYEVQPGSYVAHRDSNSAGGERWDTWYNTTLRCVRELYWDDTVSLGKKYDLVNAAGLRGVGLWNLNYGGGAPELWATLFSHFIGCYGAGLSVSPASPQWAGTHLTLTATSSGCAKPQYRFWIQPAGGGWTVVQDYSPSNTFSWTGTPGSYRMEADVRSTPAVQYESYAVIADLIRACTAAGLSADRGSPQPPGATVVLTATATCPAAPEFRFWVLPPSGRWTIAQDFSAAGKYTWSTTGKAQGSYGLEVDVRDAGSTAAYDRVANLAYTLYAAPCTRPTLNAAPASPQGTGTHVALSASTSACPNPRYRFWVGQNGGWKIVQDYGPNSSYTWVGPGAAGTYGIEVDVRDQSSTASYDAVNNISYTLTACAGARLITDKTPPQPAGTTIILTGTAGCMGKPEYRLWVKPPGRGWTIVQDYSATSTFSWNTTGIADGTYGLEVDARNQGSTALYESVSNLSFLVDSCRNTRLTIDKSTPQLPGATIVLTGSSTCLGTADYRFWVLAPGGSWTIVQDYSTTNTFTWSTAGKFQGAYGLEVDARDQGSTAPYQAVANLTFTLAAPACTTPTLQATPSSPRGSGTPVTLTASTSACPNPRYRFWIATPDGVWHIVQDYSPTSTYGWVGTGSAGSYRLEVDVRDQSSTVAYDKVANTDYTLTACTAARLTTDKASPQRAGTSIVLSGSAGCMGAPQYRFWVRGLNGAWTIVRDFGPAATFSWNTTGLAAGTYGLEVDVRNQGSTAAYETVSNLTFTIAG